MPLAWVRFGEELEAFLHVADGFEVFVEFVLIIAPKAVAQAFCVTQNEVE